MDGEWLPEPDAVPAIKEHRLRGRMLTWFNYGEYAIWHLWPEIRVSNDGRRETVYSEAVRQAHATIYADKEGGFDALRRFNPDHVWLPDREPDDCPAGERRLDHGIQGTAIGGVDARAHGPSADRGGEE